MVEGLGKAVSLTAPNLSDCIVRWLLEHKGKVKGLMLRNGEERFYRLDLLQPITHPNNYCADSHVLRDAVAIREIISIEGYSAFTMFLTYFVNALYDPITTSRNHREFIENLGLLKRFLREYEKEYQQRMR